ncbi:gas vesicle protein [Pseudonocardia sp. NPDC049154]|uniref:gas vesicle protein n=1 Tax=Pseudonocardia sp. NPDC049154 TaxID=3155501 RepID=UPI0033F514B8
MTSGGLPLPGRTARPPEHRQESTNLADILERVLDKGIVIAGDIRVNLLDIELLTIKIRLLVASVDKAREMGIDWWEHDPSLSSGQRDLNEENRRLRQRIGDLEAARTRGELEDGSAREPEPEVESELESAPEAQPEPTRRRSARAREERG